MARVNTCPACGSPFAVGGLVERKIGRPLISMDFSKSDYLSKLQNFLFTRHKMEAVVNFLVHEFCTPSFTAPPIVAMTHNLDSNHVLSYNVCQFKIVSFYHIEHNIPRLEKHGALYVGCYL